MSFGLRILNGAARIFGPAHKKGPPKEEAFDRTVGDAGVAAALIALGAKLAKADGQVTRDEIDAFRTVFAPKTETQDGVARFFDLARQTTLGYEAYARIVYRHYRKRPDILEDVLDGLFHIALADGIVTPSEMEFLETVGRIFKFTPRDFERVRAGHLGYARDDPYRILGVDMDISDAGLKKAYHALAAKNHPDRLLSRGLPPELKTLATRKMANINQAYAKILALRKTDPVFEKLTHDG